MIAALVFLQWHSVKNRVVMRFKRLKQPKYLVGAVVGGLYFYFYFIRFLFFPRGRMAPPTISSVLPLDPLLLESIGALILFLIVLAAWIVPHQRAALTFTEAEVAFLFPAPVTRRGLIHFKLMRSQFAILFTVLFLTLLSSRFGTGGHAWLRGAGWWIVLFTLNLHFMGSSFAMTMLMDRGISNWKRRIILLVLALATAGVVGVWTVRSMPELTAADVGSVHSFADYFQHALVSGPLAYLLFPFRLMVRPYFAPDLPSFLTVAWPALLLMLAHYFWVVRSDVAFEEASVEASKRYAEKIAAARSGNLRRAGKAAKARRPPFTLQPVGPPFLALLWKNLINAGSAFTLRTVIMIAVVVVILSGSTHNAAGAGNWMTIVGTFVVMLAAWALLAGPQIMRQDFRQDLPNMDLLKVFPLRGWQIALGEILAPTAILTCIHWLLLLVAAMCSGEVTRGKVASSLLLAIGFGGAIVLPMLNAISLLIPNAAVLWFPAWFQAGRQGPHGIEATGQRLIFVIGQLLAFALALIPAAVAFIVILLLAKGFIGNAAAVAMASAGAAVVLAIEAGLGIFFLGWLFERFDLSAEQSTIG